METFLLIAWVAGCFWSIAWRNQIDSMVFALAPFWPFELGLYLYFEYLLIPLEKRFNKPGKNDVDREWINSVDREQKTEG